MEDLKQRFDALLKSGLDALRVRITPPSVEVCPLWELTKQSALFRDPKSLVRTFSDADFDQLLTAHGLNDAERAKAMQLEGRMRLWVGRLLNTAIQGRELNAMPKGGQATWCKRTESLLPAG